jgi:hypothetical protein
LLLCNLCECLIQLAVVPRGHHNELATEPVRGEICFCYFVLGSGARRVDEHRDGLRLRQKLGQQLNALLCERYRRHIDACDVAARVIETRPISTGSRPSSKTIGMVALTSLAAKAATVAPSWR